MSGADFWWWVTAACLLWYSTITVYISVRGIWSIRDMLARLRELPAGDAADEGGPADR